MKARTAMQRLRGIWRSMKARCGNPNHPSFKYYGARGISVCQRWMSFENFVIDMGEPEWTMTLERVNVDGSYSPENCVWATRKEQARNQRSNRLISYDGETLCLAEWAERYGCSESFLRHRLRAGMSFGDAISKPKKMLGKNISLVGHGSWDSHVGTAAARTKPVRRLSDGAVFKSVSDAAEQSGTFPTSICRAIKRGGKTAGSAWQYEAK